MSLLSQALRGGALALLLGAFAPVGAAQAEEIRTPMIAQGCAGCHGQSGAGMGAAPRIAGYGRDAFIATWEAFRDDERPATIMNRIAPGYTDEEVAELADYFSQLR
ncbi:MAG: cytochrome C [Salinarimonas sp.]|nr:cytochrome C [Salinarimonas sp.]